MEGDVIILQDIYLFDFGMGIDEDGRFRGRLKQHRHPPEVLREARRLRHRARAVAVRATAARRQRGSAPMTALAIATCSPRSTDSPAKLVFALLVAAGVLGLGLAVVLMSGDSEGKIERASATSCRSRRRRSTTRTTTLVPKGDQALAETALDAAHGRHHRSPRRPRRAADPHRGRARAGRPAAASAGSAVLLLRRRRSWSRMLGLLVLPIPHGARARAGRRRRSRSIMLHRRRKKRLREFQVQLPGTLNLLSGSMRAGFSFAQGLEAVANEATEPTRARAAAGVHRVAPRPSDRGRARGLGAAHDSVDLMWAVMAIRIQREVGGNLAELLDTVADTMTQRERLRLEIKALTAEGRFSGWILGHLPVVFAGVLYLIQPDYMGVLFHESIGIMAIIACGVMTFVGFIWLAQDPPDRGLT